MKRILFIIFSIILTSALFISPHNASAVKLSEKDYPQDIQRFLDNAALDETNLEEGTIVYQIPILISAAAVQIQGSEILAIDGALPNTAKLIAALTTQPPIQPSTYIADVMQNAGFAQPAYAQGIGFSALTPVLQMWKAFRNIAYFFMIIVFVVIGFMIMFRKQIDHGTVVTVQMALPKVVMTLILITFSYAIAGLVVDLIYLTLFLFTEVLQAFGVLSNAGLTRDVIFGKNVLGIAWKYLMGASDVAGGSAASVVELVEGAINVEWAQWITGGVAYLIIMIAILIAAFRTFFSLVGAYIGIVISVIFAPIHLMFNALPGVNTFDKWLKGLIANAAVFPAVAIILIIGVALTGTDSLFPGDRMGVTVQNGLGAFGEETVGWSPPLISDNGPAVSGIAGAIGLGIIMLLPEIAKMIKESLEVKDAHSEAAMANLQAGAGGLGRTVAAPFKLGMNTIVYGKYVADFAGGVRRYVDAKKDGEQYIDPQALGTAQGKGTRKVQEVKTSHSRRARDIADDQS